MTHRLTTLERACELARSDFGDIRARLIAERYQDVAGQLCGPTVARALNRICAAARPAVSA